MNNVRARVRFKGRVQGVGFRYFTQAEATRNGLKGWVRNRPNGEVEAVFEGSKSAIQRTLESCRQGPPGAMVEDMRIDWEKFQDDFLLFEIRR
ncbi:MAG: acylphosphatase [Desulfuromonadaceae bacterium]